MFLGFYFLGGGGGCFWRSLFFPFLRAFLVLLNFFQGTLSPGAFGFFLKTLRDKKNPKCSFLFLLGFIFLGILTPQHLEKKGLIFFLYLFPSFGKPFLKKLKNWQRKKKNLGGDPPQIFQRGPAPRYFFFTGI